jgi:hypothetical protein
MDIFPLIYVKYRKLLGAIEGNMLAISDLPELSDGNMIYIKDFDGTEKDAPNLEIYQKLSDKNDLWVDAGPRTFGDVVDIIMAGASRITIMKNIFPMKEIPNIKEVTDSMIYTNIDLEKEQDILFTPLPGIDGLVVFDDKNQTELLKTICSQYKVYVTEADEKNISYWKSVGVAGVLLDFEKFKLVNKDDF